MSQKQMTMRSTGAGEDAVEARAPFLVAMVLGAEKESREGPGSL